VNLDNIPNQAFVVAEKTIPNMQNTHTSADLKSGTNMVTYADFINKLKPSHHLINFEANLRESNGKNINEKWYSIPKFERRDRPLLLTQV
jgi:hypothetical protein